MVEKQNTVLGSVKKPYEKPCIEVFELDNQAPLLAGSPSGKYKENPVNGRDLDDGD